MYTVSADIIHSIAHDAGERLKRRLIRHLQKLKPGLREGDGTVNLWDEICAQTQQDSDWGLAYEEEMERRIYPLLPGLSDIERAAIWLCMGDDYFFEEREKLGSVAAILETGKEDELARHILNEHVKYETMNYENATIRRMTGN
jgi:hypothetical protein